MKSMKSINAQVAMTFALAAAMLAGCAATIPQELASARVAYQRASTGPAAQATPAEVHKAHEALQQAEQAFASNPDSYHTRDLAYVAQRKAESAEAFADIAAQDLAVERSNADYELTQTQIMGQTKQALKQSQSNLADSERDGLKTAERLAAEKKANAESGKREAATSAQLATEQTARADAEKRASDAMVALANLAAVKEEERGLVITLSGSVLFASDQSVLLQSAQSRLGQVADTLMANGQRSLVVEGHTDSRGKDGHNNELSLRRAEAVRNFLIQKGYDAGKVTAQGIGKGRPIADNASAEGRANNRRVEIIVAPKAK